MNYSVKYLNLPISQKSFFADDLCDFDRVEYLNIAHDCELNTYHGSVFKDMKSLKAFHVSNPSCRYYVEKGILYTDDIDILYKSLEFSDDELQEFNLRGINGRVLVAVPPAYPTDDFIVPNGVVAIYSCAFDGCSFNSIQIPDTLKVIGNNVFDSLNNLKTLFVPNIKPLYYGNVNIMREKSSISIQSKNRVKLDEDVVDFWKVPLGVFNLEEFDNHENEFSYPYFLPWFFRSLIFPCKSMGDDLVGLKTQEGVLDTLENLDAMYGEYREMMRAIILTRLDPSLLYCKDDDIACRLIQAIWGSEEYAKHFLLAHVSQEIKTPKLCDEYDIAIETSPEELDIETQFIFNDEDCSFKDSEDRYFKEMNIYIAAHLISIKPRYVFDYLGRTFIKDAVLIPIAFEVLYNEFNKKDDKYITLNLLSLFQKYKYGYIKMPEGFNLSAIQQQAIEMNDMLTIYSSIENILHKYLPFYSYNEDIKEIEETDYNELTVLSNRLLQDDLFTGGLSRFDIISMQAVVKKVMAWINENLAVVEDKVHSIDDSIEIMDCDYPF